MAAIAINHYNLRAPRELLEHLKTFYCDLLGLTVGDRPPLKSFGYWLYAGGKDLVHLNESYPDEIRATNVQTTFDHIAFTSRNAPAMRERLHAHQIEYREMTVPGTGTLQIFFRDPAGNGVELSFLDPEG